jgi:hypothetical protein
LLKDGSVKPEYTRRRRDVFRDTIRDTYGMQYGSWGKFICWV